MKLFCHFTFASGGVAPAGRKVFLRCLLAFLLMGSLGMSLSLPAQSSDPLKDSRSGDLANQTSAAVAKSTAPSATSNTFYVREYRVKGGGQLLPKQEVEEAVYPFLGPYRTTQDVEQARAALEKAYRDQGYQTVQVQIPPQKPKHGVVLLQVVKGEVERLRIHGSRYYSLDEIRKEAPSLQEGMVPNFNQVSHDLASLNQLADRRITPSLSAGRTPGTVDVDLNVKDTLPLHGSLELNNRYSANTLPLRINGSVDYDNLWQLGHTAGASFQISPEDPSEVEVFSGYYEAHVPAVEGLSLMLQGTDQNSNVSTLGGIAVAGKGQTLGLRAIFALPAQKDFYHSLSLGFDYKHYEQDLLIAGSHEKTPVTYFPLSAAYNGTWSGKGYETDLNASVNLHLRGLGSSEAEFESNRHGADGEYLYFRGDVAHIRDLPGGAQVSVKAQGQASDRPLLNSEQFSGGGLGTVRGYLESEDLGDNALIGSAELRSPSLGDLLGKTVDEWRFYAFGEGGILATEKPLPEQQSFFSLASVGVGTRLRLLNHYNGSFDLGVPLLKGTETTRYGILLTFRLWAEF